ncbi:hypothetical protein ERO13_D13G003650v2 [Gossypium hirsutum]|nr:hypothetical protein ERO13_D13G003650v2 [Gossypium hirsutum]
MNLFFFLMVIVSQEVKGANGTYTLVRSSYDIHVSLLIRSKILRSYKYLIILNIMRLDALVVV